MRNLLRHLGSRHAVFLVVSATLLGGFEFLMCAIVTSIDISGALQEIMKSMPPMMRMMLSEQFFAGFTTQGILAFGWNHPIAHATGTALAIILGTRAIAGEIENGVLELVLSHPISRTRYLVGQILFALVSLAILSLIGVVGTIIGQRTYGIELFDFGALSKLGINYLLLMTAWYGFSLAFSVVGRESGRVASIAFVVALISYVVQVVGKLWSPANFLLPFSLHTYYSPQTILVGHTLEGKSVVILTAVVAACLGFALWHFQKRDIP